MIAVRDDVYLDSLKFASGYSRALIFRGAESNAPKPSESTKPIDLLIGIRSITTNSVFVFGRFVKMRLFLQARERLVWPGWSFERTTLGAANYIQSPIGTRWCTTDAVAGQVVLVSATKYQVRTVLL